MFSFKISKILIKNFDYQKKSTFSSTKFLLKKNTFKTFLIHFIKKFHPKKKKEIYKIQTFLSKIDYNEISFISEFNPSLLQDKLRLVNTQKIPYFFYKMLISTFKELYRIEYKCVKIRFDFFQKHQTFKKRKFSSKNTSKFIIVKNFSIFLFPLILIIKSQFASPFIKSMLNYKFTLCDYLDLMYFGALCIGRSTSHNQIRWTHNRCTLYISLYTMSSCVLQFRETSSDRSLTKIINIKLFIYSKQFVPPRTIVFTSIFHLCNNLVNNLHHLFKTLVVFTFAKQLVKIKTLRLYLVTIFFLKYPFKSKKKKFELFQIPKLIKNSSKFRSKLEIVSLVKEESTIVASPFTFKTTNVYFSLR